MKILLVTNLCSPYRVGLFELLHKMYDIRFLFFSAGEEKYYDGESTLGNFTGRYVWGFHLGSKIKISPGLLWQLLVSDYTHLIKCINGPFPLMASFVIAKLRRKKFILWSSLWKHPETTFHRLFFPVVRYIYGHSDAIVVYGSHVKRYLLTLGVPDRKISIAWQAQDNSQYDRPVSSRERVEIRDSIGIRTPNVILFVGRLVLQKGVDLLIEAFRSLGREDVSLLLIGDGPLESLVRNSNNGRIFHLRRVKGKELYRYYAISDLIVLPSVTTPTIKETWGYVINEAMCQGCAVITSDAVGAGVGGLVEHQGNGLVVPEGDVGALRASMSTLLQDNDLLDGMKMRSRAIIKDWTYVKMANGFTQALEIADDNRHI